MLFIHFLLAQATSISSVDELIEVEKHFYESLHNYWLNNNYLTSRWWFLILLSGLSPIIWWKLIDKKRITEITCFGLFYGVAASLLDSFGSSTMLWVYPVHLFAYIFPQFYPYDIGVVIVPFMMIYQRWGKHLKHFLIMAALMSAFLAFIAEPVMEWLKIYKELTWKHYYSFPIYWLLALICWAILYLFKRLEGNKVNSHKSHATRK